MRRDDEEAPPSANVRDIWIVPPGALPSSTLPFVLGGGQANAGGRDVFPSCCSRAADS